VALASISQEVQRVSKKLGLSTDLAILEHAWNLEVGNLRESARISAIDHSALVIEVDSHAVMQELTLRRRELVRKLNKHLPGAFLNQIHVRISTTSYGR